MAPPQAPLYRAERVELRVAGEAAPPVALDPLRPGEAGQLGVVFASIDPWATYNYPGERLAAFFAAEESEARRWAVRVGDELAGVVVIRHPWLHGPYLHFLAVVPGKQGQGLGKLVLDWMACEGRGRVRNLWLCVSGINTRAKAFYERNGFDQAAVVDAMVADGMDEILMRRRLF